MVFCTVSGFFDLSGKDGLCPEFWWLRAKHIQTIWNLATSMASSPLIRHKLISQNIGFGLNLLKIICTSDALYLDLSRASAQTCVWINADETLLQPIEYTLFGYETKDG